MDEFFQGIHRALGVGVGYFPVAMSFGALATGVGRSRQQQSRCLSGFMLVLPNLPLWRG